MRPFCLFNLLSANSTKWSNMIKQFVGMLSTNCLSVLDHFVVLAFKELIQGTGVLSVTLPILVVSRVFLFLRKPRKSSFLPSSD